MDHGPRRPRATAALLALAGSSGLFGLVGAGSCAAQRPEPPEPPGALASALGALAAVAPAPEPVEPVEPREPALDPPPAEPPPPPGREPVRWRLPEPPALDDPAIERALDEATDELDPERPELAEAPPILEFACPWRLAITRRDKVATVPYCSRLDLAGDEPFPRARLLIVAVHGLSRHGPGLYVQLEQTALEAGWALDELAIVTIQFPAPGDLARHAFDDEDAVLVWGAQDWVQGERSQARARRKRRPLQLGAFEAFDELLAAAVSPARLPALEQLVIFGHSAGGQFVQRHAAGSRFEPPAGVEARYVVANPSSYLYFDAERFELATGRWQVIEPTAACDPDRYRYGLTSPNEYLAKSAPAQLKARYARRAVDYLLGADDNDPADRLLDRSCEAQAQGPTRLVRGLVYARHLRRWLSATARARHRFAVLPGVGHDVGRVIESPCGRAVLFGEGECPGLGEPDEHHARWIDRACDGPARAAKACLTSRATPQR